MNPTTAEYEMMRARTLTAIGKLKPEDAVAPDRESKLHDQIEAELKLRRWYFVHSRMDRASTQQAGVVDFIIAAPHGITYWVECKKRGNKLSKEQNITRHILNALSHRYATVYSFEESLKFLKEST